MPAGGYSRTEAAGARPRTLVRGLRQVHPVFRGIGILRHLYRRMLMDAPECTPQAVGYDGFPVTLSDFCLLLLARFHQGICISELRHLSAKQAILRGGSQHT